MPNLEKFCFINRYGSIVTQSAENLNNINITNRYCSVFPCVLSLEKNINNIIDTSCEGYLKIPAAVTFYSCTGKFGQGKLVLYDGQTTKTMSSDKYYLICQNFFNKPKSKIKVTNISVSKTFVKKQHIHKPITNILFNTKNITVTKTFLKNCSTKKLQTTPIVFNTINNVFTKNLQNTITLFKFTKCTSSVLQTKAINNNANNICINN